MTEARRNWSHLTKKKIENLYSELGTWSAVAKHLDIGQDVLIGHRRRLGIPVRGHDHTDWSHLTAEYLRDLHARFHTWARVCEHLDIGPSVLFRIRRRLGMNISGKKPDARYRRKKSNRLDGKVDEIRRLAGLGWSCRMIADAIGEPNSEHVRRMMVRKGIARRPEGAMPGVLNHAWRGGRRADHDGYVLVLAPPDHPHPKSNGYICEHRLVMEQKLGRYLEPEEVVHHIDSNKDNNDPSNLELFANNGEHMAHEWSDADWALHQSAIRKQEIVETESPVE